MKEIPAYFPAYLEAWERQAIAAQPARRDPREIPYGQGAIVPKMWQPFRRPSPQRNYDCPEMQGPQQWVPPMSQATGFPDCCGARVIYGLAPSCVIPPMENGRHEATLAQTDLAITADSNPPDSYMIANGFELLKTFRSAHGDYPLKLFIRVSDAQKWVEPSTIVVPPLPAKGD
jgi:hypothetical protein